MQIELYRNDIRQETLNADADWTRIPIAGVTAPETTVVKLSMPILDIQCYWLPDLRLPSQKLHWTVNVKSSIARNFPFLTFFNLEQHNRFALGLDNLIDDIDITARMNQETGDYDITIRIAPTTRGFTLSIDKRPLSWQQCLNEWRATLKIEAPRFPSGAWEPVFCTWYAAHAAVTRQWVEDNAAIAAGLGCGTLIIDDGWCFDIMKRVTPSTIGDWYDTIGDWELSASKFPGFDQHVDAIHKLGMNYLLWVAPSLIGVNSRILRRIRDGVSEKVIEGAHVLNPNRREAAAAVTGKIVDLFNRHDLDGLKIDFIDYFRPDVENPEGQGAHALVAELAAALRRRKPDALIEFRQHYATPGMVPYATQFRAGDVPFDFLDNFNRLCQIRVILGDGIPVHADPLYWRDDELPKNISRHLIASLTGVPMLSMDLRKMSAETREIVRHWLNFYHDHKPTLNHGAWRIRYQLSNVGFAAVSSPEESIVILNEAALLPEALEACSGKVCILNLGGAELSVPGCETFDEKGQPAAVGSIMPGGYGVIK